MGSAVCLYYQLKPFRDRPQWHMLLYLFTLLPYPYKILGSLTWGRPCRKQFFFLIFWGVEWGPKYEGVLNSNSLLYCRRAYFYNNNNASKISNVRLKETMSLDQCTDYVFEDVGPHMKCENIRHTNSDSFTKTIRSCI